MTSADEALADFERTEFSAEGKSRDVYRVGSGVGVVGMCFTGGFALAMMVDDTVMAPVLSQPSLPFALTRAHRRDLGISDDDLARVKERAPEVCLLALRFTGDRLVPGERFQRL